MCLCVCIYLSISYLYLSLLTTQSLSLSHPSTTLFILTLPKTTDITNTISLSYIVTEGAQKLDESGQKSHYKWFDRSIISCYRLLN